MKKQILLFLSIVLITIVTSCSRSKHVSIIVTNEDHFLKIDYAGTIVFNDDNTGVLQISPRGYFNCKNNDDKLEITNQNGRLTYKLNGDVQNAELSRNGKWLLKQAVKEIARQQASRRS